MVVKVDWFTPAVSLDVECKAFEGSKPHVVCAHFFLQFPTKGRFPGFGEFGPSARKV